MRSCSYHIWLRQRLTMLWQGKYTLLGSSAYLKLSPEVLCFLTHMLLMGHVDVSKHTCCVSHPLQKERLIKKTKLCQRYAAFYGGDVGIRSRLQSTEAKDLVETCRNYTLCCTMHAFELRLNHILGIHL